MKCIAVDDEKPALSNLMTALEEVEPNCNIKAFTKSGEALNEINHNSFMPDVAFLDIEMPGITGLELAKLIKESSPKTKIIFITGFSQYALEAFSVNAKGYIMKPVTAEKIEKQLNELRSESCLPLSGIQIKTFGNFEVYVNGESLKFERRKSKELFAYLVSKMGAECKIREVAAVLFEDEEYDSKQLNHTQKIISSMMKAFADVGEKDVIKKGFNSLAVNTQSFDCDYYNFFKLDIDAVNSYTGEFMAQYSWAEFVAGYLDMKLKN